MPSAIPIRSACVSLLHLAQIRPLYGDQAGRFLRPCPGQPFSSSSSLGWLRRQDSLSWSERRSRSSCWCLSDLSCPSSRRSVMLHILPGWIHIVADPYRCTLHCGACWQAAKVAFTRFRPLLTPAGIGRRPLVLLAREGGAYPYKGPGPDQRRTPSRPGAFATKSRREGDSELASTGARV